MSVPAPKIKGFVGAKSSVGEAALLSLQTETVSTQTEKEGWYRVAKIMQKLNQYQWVVISMALIFTMASGSELFGRMGPARDTCMIQTNASSVPMVKNLRELINKLKTGGERVLRKGKVEQPFFSVKGRIITLGDQDVQVFEYRTIKAAELDASKISGTGSSASSMPMWIAPPHFFKNGRLIVLYVGEKTSVLKALEDALGPQFAGR